MSTLTKDTDINVILSDLWPFSQKMNGSSSVKLKDHLVQLHKEGKITILIDNLLDDKTWDATLRIHPKDLSAYGLVKNIITPIMTYARPDEIRMVSHDVGVIKHHDVLEFWWD